VAEALIPVLTPEERDSFRARGLARAAELTWEKTAAATVKVYEEACR